VALSILIVILIIISIKLFLIKKSICEIRKNLKEILKSDTNALLTISSADRDIRKLTNDLNIELKNLRNQRLQYENGNQELKKSITNISHDMRTPLTAVSGYIDLMKENKEKTKQEQYLKVVERKTNDLILLTEQLFDFSKTMDIGEKIKKENCVINEILEEALANYYSLFKEKNIIPQIEICEEKIFKTVDRNTIVRIFENILSNVTKYSNGNFKVKLDNKGKITFSNKATSLDAVTVEKIFNRYYTVENAKKSTGIGLSIAKQLVELNDGIIRAKYSDGYLIIEVEF
jgi:hypothetical protein